MHKSAWINAKNFADKYCSLDKSNKIVLDVGSWDGGNGCLRNIFSEYKYIGLDVQSGPNVDIVANAHSMPFKNDTFDVVVSSSCFEHDPLFWITFLEMCRVVKTSGYIYICAPSSGPYHPEKCPGDSWRFYPDSWKSLSLWANINHINIQLVESYIDESYLPPDENWKDSVGIFQKVIQN